MQLLAALYNIMFPTGDAEDMAREQQRAQELLTSNCTGWITREMAQYELQQARQERKA